jgi:hypothetical protein
MEPNEKLSKCMRKPLGPWLQALFFDVMTEKADQRCSISLLPQSRRDPFWFAAANLAEFIGPAPK